MLRYALRFFGVAIIAALFGFGESAGAATGIVRSLFVVCAAVSAVALFFGLVTARKGPARFDPY